MKPNILALFIGFALLSLGCSAMDAENRSSQNTSNAENVIEIECGTRIYEVQIDNLTPEQSEQLEKFKTRCRIDNVARKLPERSGLDWLEFDYEVRAKSPDDI